MVKKSPREPSMELYREIAAIDDVETCYRFFKDLCSINELRSMEQRFDVAKLLYEGNVYTEIVEQTGASSATISRVNRVFSTGTGAFQEAIDRNKARE